MQNAANLPGLLQSFFTTRLMTQRKASPHTIASYRDTFPPATAVRAETDTQSPLSVGVGESGCLLGRAFLEDLENRRCNSATSRNLRLTAIRSFFRYAALEAPAQSRNHPTGAGHSKPTAATCAGGISDPTGDRSAIGGAESNEVAGTP